ncbi:MAG: CCA tRNA nucleotidyltransferase [Planctomycetes bacterium]|nr:CCA tRNA nucleotidyltransferase [Planctomycetota bacterium]
MNVTLPNVPAASLARRVVKTLVGRGHSAYLAGGCVRDLLLHRTPKDYDVATSAKPEEVEAAFEKTVAVGKSFGVITVIGESASVQVEVATFRHDGPYSDGRHPDSVRFTNAEEDALRRDFTINALFLEPESGEVIDYVNGVRDLEARLIRAVGDPAVRFHEDKLRLLRAIRFACALAFDIDDETLEAVTRMAPQVTVCSRERIREELHKVLTNIGRGRALRLLIEAGLLKATLPDVEALGAQAHARAGTMLDALTNPPALPVSWATLLLDLGAASAAEVLTGLRCANELIARVQGLIADASRMGKLDGLRVAEQKRLLRKSGIEDDLELLRARAIAGLADTAAAKRAPQILAARKAEGLWPKVPLNGNDLAAMGIKPGPVFKQLLSALEDEVLEGRCQSKEEAERFIKRVQAAP